MRIMDALVKGLEERGYKVGVPSQRWQRGTRVEALGDRWQIRVREPTVRKNHQPTEKEREWLKKYPGSSSVPKYDYVLSNRLVMELQSDSGWAIYTLRDGKKRRVEDNLVEISLAMLRHADDDKRRAAARRRKPAGEPKSNDSGAKRKSGDGRRNSVGTNPADGVALFAGRMAGRRRAY